MSKWTDGARQMRGDIDTVCNGLPDEDAVNTPYLFMPWQSATTYLAGDRVRYGNLLYRCLQAHTSQDDWAPDVAVSLWVRIDDPAIEWPEWRQPAGAHDAYPLGAQVSHVGKRWVSDIDGNVWEPGVSGWSEYTGGQEVKVNER